MTNSIKKSREIKINTLGKRRIKDRLSSDYRLSFIIMLRFLSFILVSALLWIHSTTILHAWDMADAVFTRNVPKASTEVITDASGWQIATVMCVESACAGRTPDGKEVSIIRDGSTFIFNNKTDNTTITCEWVKCSWDDDILTQQIASHLAQANTTPQVTTTQIPSLPSKPSPTSSNILMYILSALAIIGIVWVIILSMRKNIR